MKNNVKKTDIIMELVIAAVIGITLIFGIFLFRDDVNMRSEMGNESYCKRAEVDAFSISAAIADYFADPEHNTLPTISGDSVVLGYTLNSRGGQNIAWVTADPDFTITIVVEDGSGKCPDDYKRIFPEWDSGKYTIKK